MKKGGGMNTSKGSDTDYFRIKGFAEVAAKELLH